jgi:hypothetical protein
MLFILISFAAYQSDVARASSGVTSMKKKYSLADDQAEKEAIKKVNLLFEKISQKSGSLFQESLISICREFMQYLSFAQLVPGLEKCASLSDQEWVTVKKSFEQISRESRNEWIGAVLFDSKKTIQALIASLPKLIRQQKALAKLEVDKKNAVDKLATDFKEATTSSFVGDLLMTGAGMFHAVADLDEKDSLEYEVKNHTKTGQDGKETTSNFRVLSHNVAQCGKAGAQTFSMYKHILYVFSNAPKALNFMTMNRKYTPREEEIREAQIEYCTTTLSQQIINEMSKDFAQTGNLNFFLEEDPNKPEKALHMIKFQEAAERLADRMFPFLKSLPEMFQMMARESTKNFLLEIMPAVIREVEWARYDKDASGNALGDPNKTRLEAITSLLQENDLFKRVMDDPKNKSICYQFIRSISSSVIWPNFNLLRGKLHDISPYLPLFITSKSYSQWTDILTHIAVTYVPGFDIQVSDEAKKDAVRRYWKLYTSNKAMRRYKDGSVYAENLDEYLKYKIPEALGMAALEGTFNTGIKKYKSNIVGAVNRVGSTVASGINLLPRMISKPIMKGTSALVSGARMLTSIVAPFYIGYKLSKKQAGKNGLMDIAGQVQDQRQVSHWMDTKIASMFSKNLFYYAYNTWFKAKDKSAADYTSSSWICAHLVGWYLYNSASAEQKKQKITDFLEEE